ncbi:CAAX prenyl protease 1 like protein [Nosema granulosis]|uniref:CAAX prenyl protease 1 like protein n=1 Tax=Nosema granulosis TaxID=83296 RepID=A0A9P6H181_9MICR|nr:CAAX prenyl protease 1 like protein [Nosema granulosis]
MKRFVKLLFYTFFTLTFLTSFTEYMWLVRFENELKHGRTGLPEKSASYKLAMDMDEYKENMEKAVGVRKLFVMEKLIIFSIYFAIACAILIDAIRVYIFHISKKGINLYYKSFNNICKNQVAMSNIFCFLFLMFYLYDYIDKFFFTKGMNIYIKVLIIIGLYCLICPLGLILVYFLLQEFGARLIIAVYFAIFIKNIYEIFIEDDFDKTKLVKLDPHIFTESVQDYLEKNHLENKVYQDTNKKKDTNAALVGMDKSARIEIYGDFNELERGQRDSILLHEIGHSEDHSLVKKLIVYFSLIYLEMIIMLFMYTSVADNMKCEHISQETAFILLSIVYFLSCREWMMFFYKLSSQRAEIAADLLAKRQGYGKQLASTLFKISVTESGFIRPSWLYNSLTAMHPSIYDRVEYLSK